MRKILVFLFVTLTLGTSLWARTDDSTKVLMDQIQAYFKLKDSVDKAMEYKTGVIDLPGGVAQLNIPAGFKFLNATQSKYVIEKLWGNLPDDEVLGMIFPEYGSPLGDSSYAFIVNYSKIGHVKDGDAKDINYDDLMKGMKEDDVEANRQREAAGIQTLYTKGWAAKPYYDDQRKVLHWAIELSSSESEDNTLNYRVISLGRNGMLSLTAIATMDQLSLVQGDIDKVLGMAQFTAGNRYSDFDSKVDDVAAWTVGGLVAGKILAKTAAGAGILKFLKFIIIGAVAAGGAVWKWITGRRKRKEDEMAYQPAAISRPDEDQTSTPIS